MFLDPNNSIFLSAKSKFRMNLGTKWGTYLLLFCLLVFHIEIIATTCNDSTCINGYCGDGEDLDKCLCYSGWTEENCDHCGGRITLEGTSGFIYESPGAYKKSRKCSWLIESQQNDTPIYLHLDHYGTECSWDYLYVYDGSSLFSPLVAAFSGPIQYDIADIRHELRLDSGFAYLYFYSDIAYTLDGFNITYRIGDCPSKNCSGNGVCNAETLVCECEPGWTGYGCHIENCPSNCSSHGSCINDQCICKKGYKGRDCNSLLTEGLWEIRDETTIFNRASAANVIIGDELWVIGGYSFLQEKYMPVFKYNFVSGESTLLPTTSESLPRSRYAHSAVIHEDKIIVFGGTLVNGEITSELWILNTTSYTWLEVLTDSTSVMALQGHTAHVINGSMLVFFGHSPQHGYIARVQEYNIAENSWSTLQVGGFHMIGSFGHASVYSSQLRKVYISGGFPFRKVNSVPSDPLYEYDIDSLTWRLLPSGNTPRYLHSAVLSNNKIYVFGGNSHTDNSEYNGAECYTTNFMIYDIDCEHWYEEVMTTGLKETVSRFGHQAVWHDGMVWVLGGYNGIILNDVFTYLPVNCSAVDNSSCPMAGSGPSCAVDLDSLLCKPIEDVTSPLNTSSLECPAIMSANCSLAENCIGCIALYGCGWCDNKCTSYCPTDKEHNSCLEDECSFYRDCDECQVNNCSWSGSENGKCQVVTDPIVRCATPCSMLHTCMSCTTVGTGCIWCESQDRCVDSGTYMTSFLYGTCLGWTTDECLGTKCSSHMMCDTCQDDPFCGWCSMDNTGMGDCMDGGAEGPINATLQGNSLNLDMCPISSWYFSECPSCQCNGHSMCLDGETCSNCSDYTTGNNCEQCIQGYHGIPFNGATCSKCACNGHAEYCETNHLNNKCYCDTKGIVGDQCDSCDMSNEYYGDPISGTCYYALQINYFYKFNNSEPELVNITRENLSIQPNNTDNDIYFELTVEEPVRLTISFTDSTVQEEEIIVDNKYVESSYHYRFSRYTYNFKSEANTTFLVYISNFTYPFAFQVGVDKNHISIIVVCLGTILGILSICVLLLLVLQTFCRWFLTRQVWQQREVELAEMASRPFASIFLELENKAPPDLIATTKSKPSRAIVVVLESLREHKAALATIFMQLPFDEGNVPQGQSRLTLATALINQKAKKHEHKHETREQMQEADSNPRPNTAQDIELTYDDACTESSRGYDNPAMV